MREVNIGWKKYTRVVALDEPGCGGACHEYKITSAHEDANPPFARVSFQKGPLKQDGGVNGCFMEDLIAICIDRLRGFERGKFACRENEQAVIKLEEALQWLHARTEERTSRGVEGTLEK